MTRPGQNGSLGAAILVGLVTAAFHAFISWAFPIDAFRKYSAAAEMWAGGSIAPERWVDFSPLYLAWARLAQAFFGSPEPVMTWMQILSTAVAVGALFMILDGRFGRRWAAAGATVFALDRHVLVYERILEPEAILLFVVVLLLLLCAGPQGPWKRPLASGLLGAIGVAARPTLLPICLVLATWPWLRPLFVSHRSHDDGPQLRPSHKLRHTIMFLLPVMAAVALVSMVTRQATGVWGSPNMNPGTVLFEGNQPLSNGTSAIYPPSVSRLVHYNGDRAESELGPDAAHAFYRQVARAEPEIGTVAEVNGFWSSRIRAFVADHPSEAAARIGRKWLYMFHGFQWHDLPAAWVYDRFLPVPGMPFALLTALALIGLLAGARQWTEHFVFYLFFAVQAAVMTVFYVSPRQRMVWVPVLIYFAVLGARHIKQEGGTRRWILGALTVLLTLCFILPDDAMHDEKRLRDGMMAAQPLLGEIADGLRSGTPIAAFEDELAEALAMAPWSLDRLQPAYLPRRGSSFEEKIASHMAPDAESPDPAARFDLAEMRLRIGDLDGAAHLFEELSETDERRFVRGQYPESPELYLGRIALRRGRQDEARQWLESGLEKAPGDPYLLAELYVLDGERARLDKIGRYFSRVDADRLISESLLFHERHEEALPALRRLVEIFPDSRPDRLALAAALHRTGQIEEALEHLEEADRLGPEPTLFADDMADLYAERAARADGPADLLATARGLFHYGRPAEAHGILVHGSWPTEFEAPRRRLLDQVAATLAAAQP